MPITLLLSILFSLRLSAIFDHFGYPPPRLDQWQQCTWYDLGSTQDLLHRMQNRLTKGLPAVASPLRAGPRDSPLLPTSMATHSSTWRSKLIKTSKGRGPSQGTATTGPSALPTSVVTPKTEAKKRRKKRRDNPQMHCNQ